MTGYEAIAKLNVLSSYDTKKEKREEYKECINAIIKDLEELQELKKIMGTPIQDIMKRLKILERLKKPMFYSERKKIGEEFLIWAKENNADKNDLTNIVTWCFCFKMKEWLDNDK